MWNLTLREVRQWLLFQDLCVLFLSVSLFLVCTDYKDILNVKFERYMKRTGSSGNQRWFS